jgi:hypothetical protein
VVAPGGWATNVAVSLVEISQGTFITVGTSGRVVAPAQRNAPVIEGRALFVRAHVTAAAGFTARALQAVLALEAGGATRTFTDSKTIRASSTVAQLDSTFNFEVPAADVVPGAALWVGVYDPAAPAEPPPAALPRFPAMGAADLAVKAGRMVLDLVIVPSVGPSGPLDTSPARRQRLENHLFDVYPVQKLNVRWREPLTFNRKISTDDGFAMLASTRTNDGAKPHEYYHLLVAEEDAVQKYLGIGAIADATAAHGPRRVAMTFLERHQVDSRVDTTSHELGHNHGRQHAPNCDAGGPDTRYPYPNGALGVNGWSLSDRAWKNARQLFDIMGYCNGTWVSDYTFRGFEARVRAVSAMVTTQALVARTRTLQGFLGPQATAPAWALVEGPLVTAATAGARAAITSTDGRRREAPVEVRLLSDDASRELAVDLPPPEGAIAAVEVTVDGRRFIVRAGDVPGL